MRERRARHTEGIVETIIEISQNSPSRVRCQTKTSNLQGGADAKMKYSLFETLHCFVGGKPQSCLVRR